jgi:dCTP deaminase
VILTDREIKIAIDNQLIDVSPGPAADAYSSTSLDLTLDRELTVFNRPGTGLDVVIDPGTPGYNLKSVLPGISNTSEMSSEGHRLPPGTLTLAWTREKIHLKATSQIAARVEGKSSLARIGLSVHVTAPTIHAGFRGPIQLEIVNHGPYPIRLCTGMSICQLIFEKTLGVPETGYRGQFLNQSARG